MSKKKRKSKSKRPGAQEPMQRPVPGSALPGASIARVSSTTSPPRAVRSAAPFWLPVVIVLLGVLAYANSFDGAFVFDDGVHILRNDRVHELWPPWRLLGAQRPVLDLSLAVNYAIGGTDPWGYHFVNLIVHLLAGLTLFGVVRRTVIRCGDSGAHAAAAPWLALVVAAIWTVHPLQTQSVTYIVQRSESMMGLFFLLCAYCFIRGVESRRSARWFACAAAACGLSAGCKAVAVVAPVMIVLYDATLVARSFGEAVRRRMRTYLALFAVAGLMFVVTGVAKGVLRTSGGGTVGFGTRAVTPLDYALSQPGVIIHYLSLALWPVNQLLDHKWPVASSPGQIVPQTVILAVLLFWTAVALRRRSWLGFVGAWFFVILAPTSSIVPIKDLAFEHRMYLPLAAVVAFFVVGAYALHGRFVASGRWKRPVPASAGVAIALVVIVPLLVATARRNRVYHSEIAMWQDAVAKNPGNHRAYYNLGGAYEMARDMKSALPAYRESVRLKPEWSWSRTKLGIALAATGGKTEAIEQFREAIRLNPTYGVARFNLARVLGEIGDPTGAVDEYRHLLRIEPDNAEAAYNLGNALSDLKRYDEAAAAFRDAARIDPKDASAFYNLGNALRRLKRYDEAESAYRRAVAIKPRHVWAHYLLGVVLENQGKTDEARRQFQLVVEMNPTDQRGKQALRLAVERLENH